LKVFPRQVSHPPLAITAVDILNQASINQSINRLAQSALAPKASLVWPCLLERQPVNQKLQPFHFAMGVDEKPIQNNLGVGAGITRCAKFPPVNLGAALDVLRVDFL